MPFTLHGTPVSRGISIGRAYMLARAALDVSHHLVDEDKLDVEVERLRNAHATMRSELVAFKRDFPNDVPEEVGAFPDVHTMILGDTLLSRVPETLTRQRCYSAEQALTTQPEGFIRQSGGIKDECLRERKADIKQMVERVPEVLANAPALTLASVAVGYDPDAGMIVVAYNIAPADVLQFRDQTFADFMTNLGGCTSHTAIVARGLDIPAAVGMCNANTLIRQDGITVVDGDSDIIIIDPSTSIPEEYRHRRSEGELQKKRLERLCHTPTVILGDTQVELQANTEIPEDTVTTVKANAMGVGLFHSEFLFMNRRGVSSDEEEQFRAYHIVAESMISLSVTIHTIDIGTDKPLDIHDDVFETAPNPALGLWAVHWSLSKLVISLTQLRALLRASVFGPVKILVPMLACAREIDQTLESLTRAEASLDADNLTYDPGIKVGAMIEIPTAVLILPVFLRRMDFLSIGANDLIQYMFTIDCADNVIVYLYDPLHPVVLQLIARTIRKAYQADRPVSVYGEIVGDASMTRLLFDIGLTEFSMHPSQLLSIKRWVLYSDRLRLMHGADRLLHTCGPVGIEEVLGALTRA